MLFTPNIDIQLVPVNLNREVKNKKIHFISMCARQGFSFIYIYSKAHVEHSLFIEFRAITRSVIRRARAA